MVRERRLMSRREGRWAVAGVNTVRSIGDVTRELITRDYFACLRINVQAKSLASGSPGDFNLPAKPEGGAAQREPHQSDFRFAGQIARLELLTLVLRLDITSQRHNVSGDHVFADILRRGSHCLDGCDGRSEL